MNIAELWVVLYNVPESQEGWKAPPNNKKNIPG